MFLIDLCVETIPLAFLRRLMWRKTFYETLILDREWQKKSPLGLFGPSWTVPFALPKVLCTSLPIYATTLSFFCITYDIAATTPRLDGCRRGGKGDAGIARKPNDAEDGKRIYYK